jgi:hypothetical protein
MSFKMLEQREEDELHKSRLLNVEEKPFKRATKRLLTPGSLVSTPSKLPTPPLESSDEVFSLEAEQQRILDERRQFREDVQLDFAAFDSSIARIQFLRNSNEQERERYIADKQRILDTAQAVRDSTVQLRVQLEEAKATLEQRKKFDRLAEKITNDKRLKPREEQVANLQKLEEECRELEKESQSYGKTWRERQEQFDKIVEEGQQLRKLIRDEKEEVERREGMEGGEEDGEVGEVGEVGEDSRGGQTPKHSSYSGTPRPEGHIGESQNDGLKPRPMASGSFSRSGSRTGSRAPSPAPSERRVQEDAVMADSGLKVIEPDVAADTPMREASQVPVETPTEALQVTVDVAAESLPPFVDDKMDTT